MYRSCDVGRLFCSADDGFFEHFTAHSLKAASMNSPHDKTSEPAGIPWQVIRDAPRIIVDPGSGEISDAIWCCSTLSQMGRKRGGANSRNVSLERRPASDKGLLRRGVELRA